MANASPLTGAVLVDCARANAKRGVAIAAERCGYGNDTETFEQSLIDACDEMGVSIDELAELIPRRQVPQQIRTR